MIDENAQTQIDSREDVERFLSIARDILVIGCARIDDTIFNVRWDRDKNREFRDLYRITNDDVFDCVEELTIGHYYETVVDRITGERLPAFGSRCKNQDVYIKLNLKRNGTCIVCVSFHPPERLITYPYRKVE